MTETKDTRQTLRSGMLILFITGIVSILLAFIKINWLSLAMQVVNLIALGLLVRTGRNQKYKMSLVFGLIGTVLSALDILVFAPQLENLAGGTLLLAASISIASVVLLLLNLCFLYQGTAEIMQEEGFDDAAQSGHFAVKITVASYVLLILCIAGMFALALMQSATPLPAAIGFTLTGSILLLLTSFATLVISIICLVVRVTYFWKCRKKLMEPRSNPDQ